MARHPGESAGLASVGVGSDGIGVVRWVGCRVDLRPIVEVVIVTMGVGKVASRAVSASGTGWLGFMGPWSSPPHAVRAGGQRAPPQLLTPIHHRLRVDIAGTLPLQGSSPRSLSLQRPLHDHRHARFHQDGRTDAVIRCPRTIVRANRPKRGCVTGNFHRRRARRDYRQAHPSACRHEAFANCDMGAPQDPVYANTVTYLVASPS